MKLMSRAFLLLSITVLVVGCKIEVIVPSGGDVKSDSGTRDCIGGSLCEHNVTDLTFNETFTAVARPGYVFTKWNKGHGFLCGDSVDPVCNISLLGVPEGDAGVSALLASGHIFYVMPHFQFVGVDTDVDGILDHLDEDDDNDGILDRDDSCPLNPDTSTGAVCESSSGMVTVGDPTGDVMIYGRVGDFPDYDPRADLVSYTLSWSDKVTISLTTVEIDPAKLEEIVLMFDTDVDSSGLPADSSDLPEFMVGYPFGDAYSLYARGRGVVVVCPVRRSIVAGSYVVEFDASCLGDSTELRLRSPYSWYYSVGDVPTGSGNYCGLPGYPTMPECLPYATYTDEMPGAGPLYRTNDVDSD